VGQLNLIGHHSGKQIAAGTHSNPDRDQSNSDARKLSASAHPEPMIFDTVNGKTAEKLIAKVKPGGVFASVLGAPQNAAKFTSVKVVPVVAKPDTKTLQLMSEAVRDGKLMIPISRKLPLSKAAEAQAAAEKGGVGKVLHSAPIFFHFPIFLSCRLSVKRMSSHQIERQAI